MEIVHEPAVRGRLNALVQMFEKQSKSEKKSSVVPVRQKKLCPTKLPSTLASESVQPSEKSVEQQRRMDTSFSVNTLIKTFDARQETQQTSLVPPKKGALSGEHRRRESVPRYPTSETIEWYPEVKTLVDEIFSRIEEPHFRKLSFDSRCSSARDFIDDARSFLTDTTDVDSCFSAATETPFLSVNSSGKIGALWTQDSLQFLDGGCSTKTDASGSDVHQICTKKLSEYMELLSSRLGCSSDVAAKTSVVEDCGVVLSDVMKLAMSKMNDDAVNDAVSVDKSMDVSVRTCKALIEMTVFKGETPKPTINVVNRAPSSVASDDLSDVESSVLFTVDNLSLSSP